MAQMVFYRYVDDSEEAVIRTEGRIAPATGSVCKWYTPDRYDSGLEAQRHLALRYAPTYRVGPIPSDELPDFDHVQLRVAAPAFGQPGGGLEVATTRTHYLFVISRL